MLYENLLQTFKELIQAVLDMTRKACRKKFSIALIIVWSSDCKHILEVRRYSYQYAERNIGGNPYQIFVGQVTTIDVYCWIREGSILCAEQLIFGVETSRYIDLWKLHSILACLWSILTGWNRT